MTKFTVTKLDNEWFVVFDTIVAHTLGLAPALGGYTTRRAAIDAGELLTS